jgi:hypothetical protein
MTDPVLVGAGSWFVTHPFLLLTWVVKSTMTCYGRPSSATLLLVKARLCCYKAEPLFEVLHSMQVVVSVEVLAMR